MQQVTYTHLDGTTTVYTANTAITSNVFLGTSIPTYSAEGIGQLTEAATTIFTSTETYEDRTAVKSFYYQESTEYITDFGFTKWAEERLSTEDHAIFASKLPEWQSHPELNTDPDFLTFWKRFIEDPHVVVVVE